MNRARLRLVPSRGRCPLSRIAVVACLAALLPLVASADSIACDRGIVQVGDARIDLVGKCGMPALRHEREVVRGAPGAREKLLVERWTYDFGPQRFLMVVTIEDGRVTSIERGGHGYGPRDEGRAPPASSRARCESGTVKRGDLEHDVLTRCGEPASRDRREERRPTGGPGGAWAAVEVERWTYDHGPRQFTEVVVLEDGRVTDVQRGGYGYAE